MSYEIDYNDQQFKDVEADKKKAISDLDKTYSGMINDSDAYYKAQIDASKEWEKKQTDLQNQQTDFAIQQIEQQKDQSKKDYTKEQSGAYVDWQKQSNEFGAEAEQRAAQGLANTGFSESSQVSMYNTYQNRVMTARESFNKAILNFDNSITQARLQNNSALAEIAYKALQQQLELSLQGFQYKNQLLLEQANKKTELEQMYHERWQDVLDQMNTENALAEEMRQFNENIALQREQFEWQKERASGGGGGGGGGSSRKSGSSGSSSSSAKINKNSGSSSDASVNLKSVLNSGLGPASGTTIANAVKSGTHTATQKGNQVYISKNNTSPTFGLLYSKTKF
jgi:hypothetical protein